MCEDRRSEPRSLRQREREPGSDPEAEKRKECKKMDKYVCPCGYEYDPAVGDPDNGVAPGTPWEQVPEDWVCPICGMGKDVFEKA